MLRRCRNFFLYFFCNIFLAFLSIKFGILPMDSIKVWKTFDWLPYLLSTTNCKEKKKTFHFNGQNDASCRTDYKNLFLYSTTPMHRFIWETTMPHSCSKLTLSKTSRQMLGAVHIWCPIFWGLFRPTYLPMSDYVQFLTTYSTYDVRF